MVKVGLSWDEFKVVKVPDPLENLVTNLHPMMDLPGVGPPGLAATVGGPVSPSTMASRVHQPAPNLNSR